MVKEFGTIADIAFYYEICIFIVFNYFLVLVIKRKREKPTPLKSILMKTFIGFSFAILFSAISKFFNSYWGGVPLSLYDSPGLQWIARLHAGRFGFVGVIFGTMFAYEIYLRIFTKEIPKNKRLIVLSLGVAICVILVVLYNFEIVDPSNTDPTLSEEDGANQLYELISFALILFYCMIVYIPFMRAAYKLAARLEGEVGDDSYRKAIKSLGHMATSFILIFFCFVLDRVMLIAIGWAYSAFYFLAWLFAIGGIWSAYSGFIKPAVKMRGNEE